MTKIIGIDLGTSNSVIAVMEGSKPQVISNAEGSPITPSVVAYTKKGKLLIGQSAKRQSVVNPENTFYSVKRFIGRKSSELTEELRAVSYKILQKKDVIKIDCPLLEKEFTAEEISAQVLRKLAKDASKYLGEKVKKAVITVPAYFNDSQRRATEDAGRIAGLEVIRIVNEPTAASLSYGLQKDKEIEETILVFDLGGGTLDVSILEVGEGVFEVLSTCGDSQLGGDDYDAVIVQLLSGDYYKKNNIDLTKRSNAVQRLTEAAEKAKIELSSLNQTSIYLPFIALDKGASKHIDTILTRVRFEKLCSRLIKRCKNPIRKAVTYAKLTFSQIDETVLVGGSTRIPAVQELVKKLVGKKPNKSLNPDEVVALGAAIQAGVLSGEVHNMLLIDRTPLSLGIETYGGITSKIVPKGTVIPVRKSELFSTATDNQPSVEIHILQGERNLAKDNKSLGIFSLELEPAKRGIAQIEIFFDIDASGILAVTAKDNITNRERSMTISGASTLSEEDIERMVREADINAAADKKKLKQVKIKNNISEYCDEIRKKLNIFELKARFTSQSKKKIESGVVALEGAIKKEDYSAMKKLRLKLEELVKYEEIGKIIDVEIIDVEIIDVEIIDVELLDEDSLS